MVASKVQITLRCILYLDLLIVCNLPPFSLLFALSFPSYLKVFTFHLNCDEVIFYANYGIVLLESQKTCVYLAVLLHINCLQCIVVQSLSRVQILVTSWTAACQA